MQHAIQSLTDNELERFTASGSRDAFGELYERHCGRVYDFLLPMVRDEDRAADLTQETFMRAMKALSKERAGRAAFCTWLLTIARNRAVNEIDLEKRSVPLVEEESDEGAPGFPCCGHERARESRGGS
ncbi:MAG: sigma factor [Dehalococcoidia bacterium]|nr:sigma factor [Dehalococcoidia bacterium]